MSTEALTKAQEIAAWDKAIGLVTVDMSFALDAVRQQRSFTAHDMLRSLSSLRDSMRREKLRTMHPEMGVEDLTEAVAAMPHPEALSKDKP